MSYKTLFEQYGELPKYHLDSHLIIACANGQLEHVRYLLSSPQLMEHADIHCDDDGAFISLCMYGYIEHYHHILVKKLLQNDKYQEPNYEAILTYFIFDICIKKTEKIYTFLLEISEKNPELVGRINKMFNMRDFKLQLERQLPINTENSQEIRKQ